MQSKFDKLRNDFDDFCIKNDTLGHFTDEYNIRESFNAVKMMKICERDKEGAQKMYNELNKMIQEFKKKVKRN